MVLPKVHLTSHSRMSGSRSVITPSRLSGSWRSFLYSSSVYSCHLFLIAYVSVRSTSFLSFIEPIFAWNVPLVSLIFLKRFLVFSILFFSFYLFSLITEEVFLISPCYSLEICIQMGISFLFSFAFSFSSFLSYLKVLVRQPFCLLHFFLLKMVLITASYTMSWTSVYCSSGTLSIRSNPLNLFVTSTV